MTCCKYGVAEIGQLVTFIGDGRAACFSCAGEFLPAYPVEVIYQGMLDAETHCFEYLIPFPCPMCGLPLKTARFPCGGNYVMRVSEIMPSRIQV